MCKFTFIMIALLTLSCGLVAINTAAAQGVSTIQLQADVCGVCHGTGGRGGGKIPKLNGELKAEDFTMTMRGFAAGDEPATIMDRIAKGLSEEEIKQLAEYFAGLEQ